MRPVSQVYCYRRTIQALVLELVEGPTLADRMAGRPIPVDEALPIARQIAEALEAAHEQGVIHRDLKPANVKVRPDGTVKILDFGLAKLNDPNVPNIPNVPNALTGSPTMTSPAMTRLGVILGTAAYMSPEQARGKDVDKRADVWALGCVLYEMLTARPAFPGTDISEVLAGVIKSDVAWAALPADTPPRVRALLRRCLQKDSKERLRDIGDARLEIVEAIAEPQADTTVAEGALRRSRERFCMGRCRYRIGRGARAWRNRVPSVGDRGYDSVLQFDCAACRRQLRARSCARRTLRPVTRRPAAGVHWHGRSAGCRGGFPW